jgi:hypothetical protein
MNKYHRPSPVIDQFNNWQYCQICGYKCWLEDVVSKLDHEQAYRIFGDWFVKTEQKEYCDLTTFNPPNTEQYRAYARRLPKTNYGWKAYIPEKSKETGGDTTFTVEYAYPIGD